VLPEPRRRGRTTPQHQRAGSGNKPWPPDVMVPFAEPQMPATMRYHGGSQTAMPLERASSTCRGVLRPLFRDVGTELEGVVVDWGGGARIWIAGAKLRL